MIALVLLAQLLAPCSTAVGALRAEGVGGVELVTRSVVCADVAATALGHGVSPRLAVAVAWHESRLARVAESGEGALGPMQVIPRWWCPDRVAEGCNLVTAGVVALKTYTERHGLADGLARYNAGNDPGPKARDYARRVLLWL
jgi:soluble lytic murein transglycosylase-like protein